MTRILFGGTTEGRRLACEYAARGEDLCVCVASEAGRMQLPEGIRCHVGRMDAQEMVRFAREMHAEELIDATHPFADQVTRNIRACAEETSIPYRRIVRASDADADFSALVTWARDAQEAAQILSREQGNILLTTGSNTLHVYAEALDPGRLYARVLPSVESLNKCAAAGLHPSHVIAMQGPFGEALNRALYAQWSIQHMVTKDSGDVGGVREKVLPALSMGIHVVVIRRPQQQEG